MSIPTEGEEIEPKNGNKSIFIIVSSNAHWKILWQLKNVAFRHEHPKWDHNPWFILLNETSSNPHLFMWEYPKGISLTLDFNTSPNPRVFSPSLQFKRNLCSLVLSSLRPPKKMPQELAISRYLKLFLATDLPLFFPFFLLFRRFFVSYLLLAHPFSANKIKFTRGNTLSVWKWSFFNSTLLYLVKTMIIIHYKRTIVLDLSVPKKAKRIAFAITQLQIITVK